MMWLIFMASIIVLADCISTDANVAMDRDLNVDPGPVPDQLGATLVGER